VGDSGVRGPERIAPAGRPSQGDSPILPWSIHANRAGPFVSPRSPKLHGAVERANRTHTEEFYEVTTAEPTLEAFQVELRAWETVYNTIRPHQSLGYLTPAEYLASVGVNV
jgi:transposase InsO family protein